MPGSMICLQISHYPITTSGAFPTWVIWVCFYKEKNITIVSWPKWSWVDFHIHAPDISCIHYCSLCSFIASSAHVPHSPASSHKFSGMIDSSENHCDQVPLMPLFSLVPGFRLICLSFCHAILAKFLLHQFSNNFNIFFLLISDQIPYTSPYVFSFL